MDTGLEVRIWYQDESRFGLITHQGRKITLKGVKPIGLKQFEHKCFWMYGATEPLTGESFFLEYDKLDGICFEDYLRRFSKENKKSMNLIFLDGAKAHKSMEIEIPPNIRLYFIPACSPELNPEERVWQELKKEVSWELFDDLNGLRKFLYQKIKDLSKLSLKSLTFFPYIRKVFQPIRPFFWNGV